MIHAGATPKTLSLVRVVVFGVWLGIILVSPLTQLAQLPLDLFTAIGPIRLLPESSLQYLLHPAVLRFIKYLLALALLLTLLARQPYHLIAMSTVFLLTFHQALVRGFGHINHRELPFLFAAWVLALFPADRHFTFRATNNSSPDSVPSAPCALALQTMTLILLLTYAGPAVYRLAFSTPEIFLDGSMTHFIALYALGPDYYGMRFEEWLLRSPILLSLISAGFVVVTLFEALSLLCLTSRRFRLAWMSIMVPFHCLTLVFMNIFFWQNLVLFPLLLRNLNRGPSGQTRSQPQQPQSALAPARELIAS